MFELQELHASYGKSHVVQGVSFQIGPGGRLIATYRPDEVSTPDQLAATYLGAER